MNLLNPQISFKITALASIILGIASVLKISSGDKIDTFSIIIIAGFVLFGSINFFFNFFTQSKSSLLRTSFLIVFLGAILICFLPYLLTFTNNTFSLLTTSIASGVWLLTLFFTKTKIN